MLLVDDDEELRFRLKGFLAQHFIDVVEAANGQEALDLLDKEQVDAVLLDVMMPGMDGLEVVRRLRPDNDVPILMLTGKDTEADRVLGLELGADDYIAKPFGARELLARIRSVLRRAGPKRQPDRMVAGAIEVHTTSRTAFLDGEKLDLGGIEFDILAALVRCKGEVLARESLLVEAGRNHVTISERTVDVHVSRLRKKLHDDPRSPKLIKTVHGVGYLLSD